MSRSSVGYGMVVNALVTSLWVCNLLKGLHFSTTKATIFYYVNFNVVYLNSIYVKHQHIENKKIGIYLVQGQVALRLICIINNL